MSVVKMKPVCVYILKEFFNLIYTGHCLSFFKDISCDICGVKV